MFFAEENSAENRHTHKKEEVSMAKGPVNCETCMYYIYDETDDVYMCDISLDEDEMERFLTDTFRDCPYYCLYDEYMIVRKQN